MGDDEAKRTAIANDIAFGMPGWDNRPRSFMLELRELLRSVKDEGSAIDSGGGDGTGDMWVTVGGVEYYIRVTVSKVHVSKTTQT